MGGSGAARPGRASVELEREVEIEVAYGGRPRLSHGIGAMHDGR